MGEGGKAGKIIYSQVLQHTSCSTSPHGCLIIILNLRWPSQNCWFLLPNFPAFLSQIFQNLINASSASASKQRSHSFSLPLTPFNSSASLISSISKIYPLWPLLSSPSLPPCSKPRLFLICLLVSIFCPPTEDCLSQIIPLAT